MRSSRRPTSPRCVNWRCRPPPRGSTPTSTTATASAARKRRRCAGGCWWASTVTNRPNAWCATPAGSPNVGTCPGAWYTSIPAACAASRRGCACRVRSNWPSGSAARSSCCAPARWRGPSCNMPASAAPAWSWLASRGAAGTAGPSAVVSPGVCCATARAWRSVPWTARPTCARRNRGHAIRWCGTTICWRCWRPPWPAAWPGSWRTCWSCRTSPWCS